jgi:hypothetical protein
MGEKGKNNNEHLFNLFEFKKDIFVGWMQDVHHQQRTIL